MCREFRVLRILQHGGREIPDQVDVFLLPKDLIWYDVFVLPRGKGGKLWTVGEGPLTWTL